MNIIDLLNKAKNRESVAYKYQNDEIIFKEVYNKALCVASLISLNSSENQPIIVISNKNIYIPSVYLGIALSNCYYVPVSAEMPLNKIENIIDITQAKIIVTDNENYSNIANLNFNGQIYTIDQCVEHQIYNDIVNKRKENIIDTQPLYIIFTSGSTGVPKGIVTSHSSVVDYIETFVNTFNLTNADVFGNQAPLDYIAGIRDIYIPLITGGKSIFIPKKLFLTPKTLIQYLNDNKVTTICWVSAALSLCCQLNVFNDIKPEYINKVFFTGSVFNYKDLNKWKKELPNAMFVNHYGPTEITASCTYYVVDNNKEYNNNAPIGKAFKNRQVFILNENQQPAKINETGEICVAGNCLALGYFKNTEKTNECFIQNPLNNNYPQRIYKTGDLGYLNSDGDLVFVGRKDNQIKHMGHRVELGEIDTLVTSMENINEACTVYNEKKSVITLYFSGKATNAEISSFLRKKLPSYMIPRKLINMDELPKLFNGKLDRQTLIKQLEE